MTGQVFLLSWSDYTLELGRRTHIMGVLNVTPDSFSDGGIYFQKDKAIEHGLSMAKDGADIIDVGGESTRPYSEKISAEEEMDRVVPVIGIVGHVLLADWPKGSGERLDLVPVADGVGIEPMQNAKVLAFFQYQAADLNGGL